jgi:uncharacterized damage-inducible protein DinB
MNAQDLADLFEYSYWANNKFARVIETLSPEEFTRRTAGSYGSVRNTMVHALSTEWGWLDRCGGMRRGGRLEPDNYPTPESLLSDWRRVESGMREFLGGLTSEDMVRPVEYEGSGGGKRSLPLGELMHHAVNHTGHYRAQTALLLRELGRAPGNVDLLFYYAEKRGVEAW